MPAGAERGQREVGSPRERATQKLQYLMMATTAAAALTFPSQAKAQNAPGDLLDGLEDIAPSSPLQAPPGARPERPPVSVRTVDHHVSAAELDRARDLAWATLRNITGPDNAYTRTHVPTYRQAFVVGQRSQAPQMNLVTESVQLENITVPGGSAAQALQDATMYCTLEARGVASLEARPQMRPDGFAVPNPPATLSDARQRQVVSCHRIGTVYNHLDFAAAPLTDWLTGAPANSERPNHVTASHAGATADEAVFQAMADLMRQNAPLTRDRVNYFAGHQTRGALTLAIERTRGEVILENINVRVTQRGAAFTATVTADGYSAIVIDRTQ